ncbi:DNA/RNA-binding protein KIN17 [Condylostylus longicornis]|uniref:DNA/RNA-binding protein KIN17 n=1 Tax=Condylostylus longicornis TaxID=2530218 RepID=UPI00244DE4B3|nr:DNA/RNA-binding protein KIN17 [Condylostylus longicornis]
MGRAEVGTPKYLANKMKAKGLQKLRWYCQMCQKQCRDENGFKCHTQSEAHQRQLLLFAETPGKYIYSFSKEFSDGFLEILRRRFGTKRVNANKVYQEYISDKNHLHMNATRWLTLSDYVKWLGRSGICVADETEKGWFITYIDRSPEALEAQQKKDRKEKADKDDQERMMEFVEKQIERAKATEKIPSTSHTAKEFQREEEEPLKLELKISSKLKTETVELSKLNLLKRKPEEQGNIFKKPKSVYSDLSIYNKKQSALDEIIKMEESKKEKQNRKDYWLAEDIVVKFISKSLGGEYYKQKAIVCNVIDNYQAKIKFIESGKKFKVDQEHLETVIPAIGKPVKVLNGAYRGCTATLLEVKEEEFNVSIEIAKGPLKGRVITNVQYEDISKLVT